ncbi:unnamed protein product [Medioppia subpectinata]|uniref:TEP1-F n=1 Tax=Medioppia subpectinata TaxID=1979941 RepID=A0A7R9KU66_9ACAR|nr:unnamed protein product [Medioppia subpectinata]CAG2109804.1 unnamed protein product [Medioppia subpectinata]
MVISYRANGGKPMYVVVAPNVLRPNTDYHISVSLYDIPAPIEVNASVIGPAHSISTGAVAVGTAESKVLTLAIGDWPKGRYRVQVEGKGANFTKYDNAVAITRDSFLGRVFLYYEAKCVSVFIQTDKATYKTGQKVQFRAVVVNPSLIPKDNVPIDIHINDGNGKRVIEWTKFVIGPAHSISTGAVAVGTAESKVLTLAIGDWPKGRYRVQVEGKGANFTKYDNAVAITRDSFLGRVFLYYEAKCVSVFIQTDKATYKTGQKVQFRAVVVNPSLIPKDNVPIDIHINDGNGKRVIEWTKLYAKNGVIAEELQLSAQPVLGHWTIGVMACRHNTTKTFTVVDDMFPTFDVEVVLPTYVTTNRSEVVALVKAFDTNGKAIKGELTLFVRAINYYRNSKFRTKTAIDGSVTLTINLVEDLQIKEFVNNKHREFEVTAVVRDTLTGKQCNRTNTVNVYERDLKFDVIMPSTAYKLGLKNTFVVKVCTQDGKPVADSGPQVKLQYGFVFNNSKWINSSLLLSPTNGLIKFDVFPPRDMGRSELVFTAEYMGLTYDLDIKRATTRSGHYMQVIRSDTTNDITVGQEVKFIANATEPIGRLVCEVMGKGDIAWAKSFDIPANTTAGYEFSVATVPQMVPTARVMCYYVRPDDREVVADDIDFDVVPVIGTPFTVNADTRHTSPGEFGCVWLNTSHNPFVDVSREDVVNELKTYVRTTRQSDHYKHYRRWDPTMITFDESAVGVIHNGFIQVNYKANGGKPMYVVVAPNVLRPNTDYHISVSLYDIPAPIEVNATVIGPAHNVSTGAVAVGTGESKVLTLAIGNWPEGDYKVQVMGKGANFTKYDVVPDGQDKAVYKPGQKVQFRAVVVNPSLIPKDNVPIDIYIEDGNGKRVIEWRILYAKNGVICEELQLSAQPVLGHWTIGVMACRHNTTKTFTVVAADENLLPTFDVEVVLPTYVVTNRSSEVVATIKAIDTNGKAVKGDLTLTVETNHYNPSKYRTKATIDGSATIAVNLAEDLALDERIVDSNGDEIEFTARVKETVTGKEYNKSHTIKIYDRDVRVELIKTSVTYKPGLKNTFHLKVVTQDSKPVADSGPQLKLKYGYSSNESEWKECKDSPLLLSPTNGVVKFDVFPPKDINLMEIKAEYKGLTYDIYIAKAMTRSGHYMQVLRLDTTTDITVGQDVKFMVNATEPIVRLVCEVMGKGDIAWAKSFDIQTNITAGYEFSVATVPQMAPTARVLCHYVRPDDREVVADAIDFDVVPVFRTPVTAVDIKPEELAGVGLMTSNNPFVDISVEDVVNELKTYNRQIARKSSYFGGYEHSLATVVTFDESGVGVMHNGFILIGYKPMSGPDNCSANVCTRSLYLTELKAWGRHIVDDKYGPTKRIVQIPSQYLQALAYQKLNPQNNIPNT